MLRCKLVVLLLLLATVGAQALAPRAACWRADGVCYLAALDAGRFHLARWSGAGVTGVASLPAYGITTLAVGSRVGAPVLLAARGRTLLRFDLARRRWIPLLSAPTVIQEIHPDPQGSSHALLLTGTSADRTINKSAVWWVGWGRRVTQSRVTAVKDYFHPWQLCWTRVHGKPCFAAATYKATPFVHFPHNCMFLFDWLGQQAAARWLGSRLSRPYVDVTHAPLRDEREWRMVALENTREHTNGLDIYHPIGFGYEGEWRNDDIPGLQHVASFGPIVLCWGQTASGAAQCWRLLPLSEGYRLLPLPTAPPSLATVTLLDHDHIAGWWLGGWHVLELPNNDTAHPACDRQPSVLLAAVGDVMLARTVPQRLVAHGVAWPWEKIAATLRSADLRFCNLECTVSKNGLAIPKRYSFRADPTQAMAVLAAGAISVVSLANNHSYDYGRSALADTMAALAEQHIAAPGAGIGRAGAIAPRLLTCHGLKIAFIAYTCWTPEGYLPADDAPALATLDESTLAAEIKAAKKGADLLVLSVHWGKEYSQAPGEDQQRIAHLAIDAGADVLLGHHPHVTQPVEIYHGHPICYSLGNCLFDRSGSRWSNGLLVRIRLSKEHATVEKQIPLHIEDARPVPESASPPGSTPASSTIRE